MSAQNVGNDVEKRDEPARDGDGYNCAVKSVVESVAFRYGAFRFGRDAFFGDKGNNQRNESHGQDVCKKHFHTREFVAEHFEADAAYNKQRTGSRAEIGNFTYFLLRDSAAIVKFFDDSATRGVARANA